MDLYVEALCWLRFGKKLPYVCTEGGYWNADVLGLNDKFSVEVEIKVSKADLKRDFATKTSKHYLYGNAGESPSRQVPNYFYFFVPSELEAEAVAIVSEKAPKAGVAVFDTASTARAGDRTRVARRPTKLHDKEPSVNFKETVLLRMGSELCGRYQVYQRLLHDTMHAIRSISDAVPRVLREMLETKDADPEAT
jgi:hypothetical protein